MSLLRPYVPIIMVAALCCTALAAPSATARADEVDDYVEAQRVKLRIPGLAVLVIKDGQVVKSQGYGLANVEHNVPVTAETVFQLGSVGKQFTAMGVMMLVEDGRLALDDSIRKYLPGAPESWQPITVRQLLSHTAGLGDLSDGLDLRRDYTSDQLLEVIYAAPLKFAPGEDWRYSNLGYVTLGILIEKVTGRHYGELLGERIFKPLGMYATRIISEADIVPHRAAGYELRDGVLNNQDWVSPTLNTTADGSLYTNILDMARWDAALAAGKLVKPETFELMWTPVKLTSGEPNRRNYGFGWFCDDVAGRKVVRHGGAWQGFVADIARYLDDKLTVITLANLSAGSVRGFSAVGEGIAGLYLPVLKPGNSDKASRPNCALQISLVDSETDAPLPGIIQVVDGDGQLTALDELVNRGQGIDDEGPIHDWWVLPKPSEITVPATKLAIKALSGLETEMAQQQLDLTGKTQAALEIPLKRFYRARERGHIAGNTHLHLRRLSKEQADRYLQEVPLGDGLHIVFLSYLERARADLEYTSNKYSRHDLEHLSHEHLHFGHGQEHRHNFGPRDEGYGHILLLDIPYIIQPVSIGPGITEKGTDAPPLQQGIDEARRSGGKVIWAHNLFGFEDIPNWVTGRVHANNIFDGSAKGSYKDTYYRYLNLGLHVPFSSGTDWFIYDFSRVYVTTDRPVTPTEWLDLLAAGKSFITNGPLLEWSVEGQPVGSVIDLPKPATVTVHAKALGRQDFKRIELVQSGSVVGSALSEKEGDHFAATLELSLMIDTPSWLAVRTPPPPVKDDPELQEPVATNEFGGQLFAHTSPIYVNFGGQGVFDPQIASELVAQMKSDLEKVMAQAVFTDDSQREQVRHVYQEAIEKLEGRLAHGNK